MKRLPRIALLILVAELTPGLTGPARAQHRPEGWHTQSQIAVRTTAATMRPQPAEVAGLRAAGAAGAVVGGLGGAYLGYAMEQASGCAGEELCGLVGAILGGLVGEIAMVPIAIHLANGRRGDLPTNIRDSGGVFVAGLMLAGVTSAVVGPVGAVIAIAVPLVQIDMAVGIERRTGAALARPAPLPSPSPPPEAP